MSPLPVSPPLIGRAAEVQLLREAITDTSQRGQCLELVGEAGAGKSTLLAAGRALAEEAGCRVLFACGIQAESRLPFAGLHRLLQPVMAAAVLPTAQLSALRTALGFAEGPAPAPFLTGLATLTLLTEAAVDRRVVVLVDDLQWLDEATQTVLAFVARRLSDDPVSLITARRAGEPHHFTEVAGTVHTVGPVDDDSARQILASAVGPLTDADRSRMLSLSRGNPLALVELSRAQRDRPPAVTVASPDGGLIVPLTERLQSAFAGRAAELPATTRDLLLVTALTDSEQLIEILAATSHLTGHAAGADVADPAVEAGLLTYDALRVRFRHPLVRSAIAGAESPGRQQSAHRALARALDAQPERQLRFLALAVTAPDERVAASLTRQADSFLRRGAMLDAVAGLEHAARLTPDPLVRGQRMLLAAEHAFGLGRTELVRSLVDQASAAPLSELDRARLAWLAEIFDDGNPGDVARVLELCATGKRSAAAGDVDLALHLLYAAGVRCWWSGAGPTARTAVVEALRSLGEDPDPRVAVTLATADPLTSGRDVARVLEDPPTLAADDADSWRALGQAAWATGDCVRCVDMLDRAAVTMRAQGRLGVLAHVLNMQANARLTLGEWVQAEEGVTEGRRLAQETGQPIWVTGSGSVVSMLAGLRGDPTVGPGSTSEAEAYAHARGLADQLSCVALARAFSHAGANRPEQAFEELRTAFDPSSPYHHERESIHGLMFFAEAAVQVGRVDEAAEVMGRMEELATITPSPLLHVHLLYARPVLAATDAAEELYERALAEDLTRWPWVRARVELAYGAWLRRQRRPLDSRIPLRSAHQTLVSIGARHWAARAAAELRASGERPLEVALPAADLLSPQELQIARLAAQGLTNRDIAEQLFCSSRTVASHLYHVFPKLGVTSRTQLAARLGAAKRPVI